jgi:hypothetical protein
MIKRRLTAMRQPVPLFSRWLSVTFFSLTVVLALGLISVCWAKEELDRAIHQARGNIRELSTALEREPKAEKAEQRKAALEEYQAQLKQLLGSKSEFGPGLLSMTNFPS